MADKFDSATRSRIMAQIKSKNTSIERMVFSYLRRERIYFQKHYSKALGSPDIALPRKKRAVFIDGDFWHGKTLERRKDSLPIFWAMKITRNVKRDRKYRKVLREDGWAVLRIWESDLKKKSTAEETLQKVKEFLVA